MRRRADAAVLCLAILLTIGLSVWCHRNLSLTQDAVHYMSLAEHLARGQGYRSGLHVFPDLMQPPLYPLLVAAVSQLLSGVQGVITAALIVCIAAQVALVFVLGQLHRALWGRRGWHTTVLLAAVAPHLAYVGYLLLEPLFLCLAVSGVYLGLRAAQQDSPGRAAGAGLCLGLALLVRPEVVLTAPVVGLLLLVWPAALLRRLRWLGAAAVAAALVVLPYGLWMRSQLGHFEVVPKLRYNVPLTAVLNRMEWAPGELERDAVQRAYFTLLPDASDFALNRAFRDPGFDPLPLLTVPAGPAGAAAQPPRFRHLRYLVADGLWHNGAFHPLVLFLMVVGAWWGWRETRGRGRVLSPEPGRLAWAAVLALPVVHLVPALASGQDYATRFLAATSIFAILPAALGAAVVAGWLAERLGPRAGLAAPAIALFLSLIYVERTRHFIHGISGGPAGRARTAELLRACEEHLPPGARVLSEHSRYGFLRGGASYQLPYTRDLPELLRYIRRHRLEYAVLEAPRLRNNPSRFNQGLADPASWAPTWRPLARLFGPADTVWILRLDASPAPVMRDR